MKNIHDILLDFSQEIRQLFGDKLTKIILYGSYARGEQRENSDVDIMILADMEPEEVSYYADKAFDIAYEFELRFQIERLFLFRPSHISMGRTFLCSLLCSSPPIKIIRPAYMC